jgi:LmbE family N-acetylglucosaminyl deacetylase
MEFLPIENSRKSVFIIVPHPDDLEILAGHAVNYFLDLGYQIYEILFSFGEYGVVNQLRKSDQVDRIKGLNLRKIRKKENFNAKQAYGHFSDGTARVITIPMTYIDGHVPFNQKSVRRIQELIKKIKPSVIISPDPLYSIDWHHDHMNTGRTAYYAVKKIEPKFFPQQFLLFQTFKPNYRLPINSIFYATLKKAHQAHRSQLSPLGIKLMLGFHRYLVSPFRAKKQLFRKVELEDFNQYDRKYNKLQSLKDKIMYYMLNFTHSVESTYIPSPTELGLDISYL